MSGRRPSSGPSAGPACPRMAGPRRRTLLAAGAAVLLLRFRPNSTWLVLGGAVQGGRLYGAAPVPAHNGPDDVGQGRLLPSTAVDKIRANAAAGTPLQAASTPDDIAACTDAGMTYFVPKPITPPMLLGAITHVMTMAQAEEAPEAETVAA